MLGLCVLAPLMALIARADQAGVAGAGVLQAEARRQGREALRHHQVPLDDGAAAAEEETVETNVEDIDTFMFRPAGRKTSIGRTLRACSLDELPNLFNVLRGDLHLVGPRPDEPELVAQYRPEWRQRHDVKPGITGVAQIHGRTDLTYQEMMAYDLEYVR